MVTGLLWLVGLVLLCCLTHTCVSRKTVPCGVPYVASIRRGAHTCADRLGVQDRGSLRGLHTWRASVVFDWRAVALSVPVAPMMPSRA